MVILFCFSKIHQINFLFLKQHRLGDHFLYRSSLYSLYVHVLLRKKSITWNWHNFSFIWTVTLYTSCTYYYTLEISPLSSQFEYRRKENKRRSSPSLKFGDTSKLCGKKYMRFYLLLIPFFKELFANSTRACFLCLKCCVSSKI